MKSSIFKLVGLFLLGVWSCMAFYAHITGNSAWANVLVELEGGFVSILRFMARDWYSALIIVVFGIVGGVWRCFNIQRLLLINRTRVLDFEDFARVSRTRFVYPLLFIGIAYWLAGFRLVSYFLLFSCSPIYLPEGANLIALALLNLCIPVGIVAASHGRWFLSKRAKSELQTVPMNSERARRALNLGGSNKHDDPNRLQTIELALVSAISLRYVPYK